jgi:hypothetical protein
MERRGTVCSQAYDLFRTTLRPVRFRVPYSALTDCFDEIDKTAKRLLISNYLTQFLLKVAMNPGENGDDLRKVVYLCINRVSSCSLS